MLNIKLAVNKAKEYLVDFFPEKADSIRLEETELNEDGNFWKVTLSFIEENDNLDGMPKSSFSTMFGGSLVADHRVYKSLKVRTSDGEVLGMTIWKA